MTPPDPQEAERFVFALYQGVLGRPPDPPGLQHYVRALLAGRSQSAVAGEFIACDEFRHRRHAAAPPPLVPRDSPVKLFVPPGHYYSPIVDPEEAGRHFDALEAAPMPDSLPDIRLDRAAMVQTWRGFVPAFDSMLFQIDEPCQFRYKFGNPSYSFGDGSVLHAMLRKHRPKRLIEIGSGWSSACTLDTVEHYLDNECELTFIEPYPKLLLDLIGEAAARVRVIGRKVQEVPPETFDVLEAGDILFIDSTHILRTGSDVCYELFSILPRLARGVIVHIHDMFWPFEYPRDWAVDENRSWNELYAVRAFLSGNDQWRILMFNHYMAMFERPLLAATHPDVLSNCGGALWLQRQ